MSDRDRILTVLREVGRRGMHSHDLRQLGYSGNPAQRIAELRAQGHAITGQLERRNGRNGKRWRLVPDVGGGADTGASSSVEEVRVPSGVRAGTQTSRSPTEESLASAPGTSPGLGAHATHTLAGGARDADGAPGQLFDSAPLVPHDREVA